MVSLHGLSLPDPRDPRCSMAARCSISSWTWKKTTRREERDTLKPHDNYVQTEGFLKFNKDLVEFIGDYWDYKGLFNGFL